MIFLKLLNDIPNFSFRNLCYLLGYFVLAFDTVPLIQSLLEREVNKMGFSDCDRDYLFCEIMRYNSFNRFKNSTIMTSPAVLMAESVGAWVVPAFLSRETLPVKTLGMH